MKPFRGLPCRSQRSEWDPFPSSYSARPSSSSSLLALLCRSSETETMGGAGGRGEKKKPSTSDLETVREILIQECSERKRCR